ncbi:hypothetical protein SAMN05421503_3121 [Terribacillus aidingensis]|uniref:Cof subfamily of IIB subfamily of haloacid dehalogenase superfamily/HAD-superfamily hydrolase, subfamily IIB n=2 Tax=Terribacillus aidingensis TaxID=586416 RepID=A0A285P5R6_9BACI|nr:hypothetical protein SAMN05421503_3121 [Terribacillus aidingensis]
MSKKMIAIDLDGTLLNTESQIPEENKAAIKRALDADMLVAISTGRATFDVKSLVGNDLDIPIIASNGGTVHDYGYELLNKVTFEKELAKEIAASLIEQDVYFEVYTETELLSPYNGEEKLKAELDKVSSANPDESMEQLWIGAMSQFKQSGIRFVPDIEHIFTEESTIFKILCFSFDLENLAKAYKTVNEDNRIAVTSSGEHIIEILPKKSGKGYAVSMLAEKYNISKEDVYAVGDSPNDISMFEVAGNGVAMENAMTELMEIATHVTKSNDDFGVAYFLDKLIAGEQDELRRVEEGV